MDHSDNDKSGYERSKAAAKFYGEQRTQRAIAEYEANPKFCGYCGARLPFEKRRSKFCDHSCAASYNNRGVTRHIKGSKTCECGNEKKPHNKYCADCAQRRVYQRPQSVELLKAPVSMRKLLIEQRGHRCQMCGLTEWLSQPIPLELHHVDGDSDNNTSDNLMLVCPNCHTFTPHYKGAVKGKDGSRQRMRRKRYANGETW